MKVYNTNNELMKEPQEVIIWIQRGAKLERQRIKEEIKYIIPTGEILLCDCNDDETEKEETGQHSWKCSYIIFRDSILKVLEDKK